MIRILFVCHGNICRSPMAEYVMKHMAGARGLSESFFIDSAATSNEELGHGVHHGTRGKLREFGVPCGDHRSQQLRHSDYARYDYLVGMDRHNMRDMLCIVGSDPEHKLHALLDFTNRPGDIADPWYTGDFTLTYGDVVEGCEGLLKYVLENDKDKL